MQGGGQKPENSAGEAVGVGAAGGRRAEFTCRDVSAEQGACRAAGRLLPSTPRAEGVLVLRTMPTICFL